MKVKGPGVAAFTARNTGLSPRRAAPAGRSRGHTSVKWCRSSRCRMVRMRSGVPRLHPAAQREPGVGGVDDQPAVAHDLHHLSDGSAAGRVGGRRSTAPSAQASGRHDLCRRARRHVAFVAIDLAARSPYRVAVDLQDPVPAAQGSGYDPGLAPAAADAALVASLRAGDADAFATIVRAWSPAMLRVARRFVHRHLGPRRGAGDVGRRDPGAVPVLGAEPAAHLGVLDPGQPRSSTWGERSPGTADVFARHPDRQVTGGP